MNLVATRGKLKRWAAARSDPGRSQKTAWKRSRKVNFGWFTLRLLKVLLVVRTGKKYPHKSSPHMGSWWGSLRLSAGRLIGSV